MLKVTREQFECPHCGKVITAVSNWDVDVSKFDMILSVCLGLGMGIIIAVGWHVSWWGTIGSAFLIGVITFLVSVTVHTVRRSRVSKYTESEDTYV